MVTQTDLLGLLVASGQNVALIAPDENDENLVGYCKERGIALHKFSPTRTFWSSQYQEARKYFLEDIKSNPVLWEKHVYATRYNTSKNPWKHVRPRLLLLLYHIRRWLPFLKDWYKQRENHHLKSTEAAQLLKEIDPGCLVSTYPVNFNEAMLLREGNILGVKTFIHLLSWDNISCKGHFPQMAEEYLVWGPVMRDELRQYYGIPPSKIHLCGVPHFDVHVQTRKNPQPYVHLRKLGLESSKPYLFFGMSSPRFAPKEIDIVEWLANCVRKNTFGEDMQLVIRPHPQNVQGSLADQSWLPRLEKLKGWRVGVDFPRLVNSDMPWSMSRDDMVGLSHLLAGSSVSLNSGSTLAIDSLVCATPCILTAFDGNWDLDYWRSAKRLLDYPHLKKLTSDEGVSIAHNFEELTKLIIDITRDPAIRRNEMQLTLEKFCLNSMGCATETVVNTLKNASSVGFPEPSFG